MSALHVNQTIVIDAPIATVRAQFADVAHHAATGVHDGVEFTVTRDDGQTCEYRQVTNVGPLRLRQDLVLDRTETGPLVNTIVAGQLAGGSISFDCTAVDPDTTRVEATVTAPLGLQRVVRPLLQRQVARALAAGLAEDKTDIETGSYPAA